jgi:parvulin-like peptidyl-prolyl isomerase
LKAALRSLIHFLLLGLALFVGERVAEPWLSRPARPRVEIDAPRVAELRRQWELRMGLAPRPEELRALVEAEIDDELLFQEALALGWVETDPVVRRRLVQNVRFLGSESGEAASADEQALFDEALALGLERSDPIVRRRLIQRMRMGIGGAARRQLPSDQELRAHYKAHAERYIAAARVQLSHVYVGREGDAEQALARARALRTHITAKRLSVDDAVRLGAPFLRGHHMPPRSERELAGIFGPELAAAVFGLPVGRWSDPIESAYGYHLVWVHAHEPAHPRPLEEVQTQVREEILAQREAEALARALRLLREQYELRVAPLDGAAS